MNNIQTNTDTQLIGIITSIESLRMDLKKNREEHPSMDPNIKAEQLARSWFIEDQIAALKQKVERIRDARVHDLASN